MTAVRSVTVRLSANTSAYIGEMKGAAAATERVAARMSTTMTTHAKVTESAMNRIGRAAKYTAAGVAVGYGAAVKAAADFGSEMATVNTLAHAHAREAKQLRAAAMDTGTAYGYTATQVAKAEEELVKAGISTKDILGGSLKGALTLAAAGQTDVATATEVAASAMTQFRLKGKDVPRIADMIAAGADKALGGVQDLGYGLEQAGTQAKQSGWNLKETTATLAAFAQAGLIGERGGTTLKQMMLQLESPTKKAQDLMDQYGLSLFKANGQVKNNVELAENLRKGLGGLTLQQREYALGVIFGSRAIQGANILMANGARGMEIWNRKIYDMGFATQQASGKLNSLKGDLKKFKAEGLDALIELGDGSQAPLRKLVQNITHWLHEARMNGDLRKWGDEAANTLERIVSVAATAGRDLQPLAATVGHIVESFTKLPDGLQKLILGGAVVGYGAKRTGILDLTIRGLRSIKQTTTGTGAFAGRAGVVPVYVTNPGFGTGRPGGGGLPEPVTQIPKWGPALIAAAPYSVAVGGPLLIHQQQANPGLRNTSLQAFGGSNGKGNMGLPVDVFDFTGKAAKSAAALAPLYDALHKIAGVKRHRDSLFGFDFPETSSDKLRSYTDSLKQMDNVFDRMARRHPAKTWTQLKDAFSVAGVPLKQIGQLLPQTARDLESVMKPWDFGRKGGGIQSLAQGVDDLRKSLVSLPRAVFTQVNAKGADTSMAAIRKLTRQYNLTPRQVETLIELTGAGGMLAQIAQIKAELRGIPRSISTDVFVHRTTAYNKPRSTPGNPDGTGADGTTIPKTGRPYGDRHLYLLADGERVTSNRHGQVDKSRRALDLINQGRLNDHILGLADGGRARTRPGGDGSGRDRSKPLFTHEGPRWYAAAYKHNRPFAKAGPSHRDWPYQTGLTANQERAFERWVSKRHVPFDPNEQITDYDMRGYWKKTRGRGWRRGSHFPDTYKTPYDTTFSHESKYATKNNPFFWHGNKLIDQRNGQVIFAADGNTVPKTGRGYADRHLYLLADGEEVITNRHGEADRHRPLLKAINAGRLAEGGTVRGPGVSAEVSFYSGSGAAAASKPPTTKVHIDGVGTFTVTETDVKNAKYIARLSHQTLVEKHADRLSELQAEQHVRDLRRSLTAMVGKKGHRHLALTGLDRKEAQAELAAALDDLKAIRDHSDAAKQAIEQVRQAQADARKQAQEERQQAKADALSSVRGNLDVFSRGLSATGALSSVTRMVADITTYGQLLGQLRAKNVSPVLLDQIVQHANGGDFAGAIRLMRSLLNSPATLAQVNSALGQYSTVTNQVANLTSDPRFSNSTAWAGATQVVKSNTIQFNFAQNPTALLTELQRVVQHYVQAEMAKAGA